MHSQVAVGPEARRFAPVGVAQPEALMRGQFVLGPQPLDRPEGWTTYRLLGELWLTAHPELPVCRVAADGNELTLIGYALDPEDPSADDESILRRLLAQSGSSKTLLAATAGLGGRWALVALGPAGRFLFTDALGLRQVFHTLPEVYGAVWAMSQPGLALDALGGEYDDAALRFADSYAFRAAAEYRWPGTATPVIGLRHLLPNHYLDLRTGEVRRYWPDAPIAPVSPAQAIERATALLRGLMHAAGGRFDLALSITAGIDSRLVLAASRDLREQLRYVTVRQGRMADDCADIAVPARLLARLRLPHDVIRARASMSPAFAWTFKRSVLFAHDHYGGDAEAILLYFGRRRVAVTGSGAEVARCSYRKDVPFSDYRRLRPEDLARLQRLTHPFAVAGFADWLRGARERANVKLLDLFEWEQGHGTWLAMVQLEFDSAWRDIFTPYNCRALLSTLLGVSERYRRAPDYTLFRQAIHELWPDLLSEPINPKDTMPVRLNRWLHRLRPGGYSLPRPT